MLCLIKNENIFARICGDLYIIEYQKHSFSHIHLLIFLNLPEKFSKTSHIDQVIYAKLLIIKIDPTRELIKIMTSIILHDRCGKINPHSPYMNNTRDIPSSYTKHYSCHFLE